MKKKELAALLDDLIECGNKLAETAKALKDYCSSTDEEVKQEPAQEDVPKEEPRTYDKVAVRVALKEKAYIEDRKYNSEVKALVTKYSTDGTFSGIPDDKLADLMKELEGIGNG